MPCRQETAEAMRKSELTTQPKDSRKPPTTSPTIDPRRLEGADRLEIDDLANAPAASRT